MNALETFNTAALAPAPLTVKILVLQKGTNVDGLNITFTAHVAGLPEGDSLDNYAVNYLRTHGPSYGQSNGSYFNPYFALDVYLVHTTDTHGKAVLTRADNPADIYVYSDVVTFEIV